MGLDEQVVNTILKKLFYANLMSYNKSLKKSPNRNADVYTRARNALAKPNETEKEDVLKFIDMAIADSDSVLLGTLDGSHFPDNIDGGFIGTYKADKIQGSLQDIFIEKVENSGIYN